MDMTMRDTFIELLREIPSHRIIFRPLDGTGLKTAGDIIKEIENNTTCSKLYCQDMLRIVRDFLAREAIKEKLNA